MGSVSVFALALWLVVVALVGVTVVAWAQPRQSRLGTAITGVAPIVLLSAWPCAVISGVRGEWAAFFVCLLIALSQLAFSLPSMHPWSTARAPAGGWRLSVYDHNVLYTNLDLSGVAAQIADLDPDVIALEELSYSNVESLKAGGVLSSYPYEAELLHEAGRGLAVWSKVPMSDAEFWAAPGHPQFSAILHPPGEPPLSFTVIHAEAPVTYERWSTWARDLAAIGDVAASVPKPAIFVGDFNATATMRTFRPVLRARLVDGAATSGNGWRCTWRPHRLLPTVMRIDHALHTRELTVTSYRLGHAAGSDHRPIIVTFARAALAA